MFGNHPIVKKAEKYKNLIKALLMSLLPLLAGILLCAADGRTIADLSMTVSEWNDELFYYKQVESILNFGFPQGYFGFNESHAQYLSFAAWSPVLVFPWIIWGFLFGWSLMSPVYCNIFILMLSTFLFVLLTKPGKKQMGVLAVLYLSNLFLTRYMLSCMPEAICAGMAIIFLAVCYNYETKPKGYKLGILFGMVFVMTLMRPYLLLFLLFPAYHCVKKYKWKGMIWPALTLVGSFAFYLWINKYLSAEYFTPLFKTQWLTAFRKFGIWTGIRFTIREIKTQICILGIRLKEGILAGIPAGVLYIQFFVVTFILGIQVLSEWRKKEKKTIHGFLFLCCIGIFGAILLMYKLTEGSRHLVLFLTIAIFAIGMMETRFYKKAAVTAAVFLILYQRLPVSPYFYELPYKTVQKEEDYAYWEAVFQEKLFLNPQNVPNYDNVVIWTLGDVVAEENKLTEWQMLYALPKGFGISCCEAEYVIENFQLLQCRYLAVVPGGTIDRLCETQGKTLIGSSEGIVLYQMR